MSDESVPVWKLAVSEAVIVPAGDQFAAVDQFLFAPPPVHVNVSALVGIVTTQMAMVAANITGAEKIVFDFIVFFPFLVCSVLASQNSHSFQRPSNFRAGTIASKYPFPSTAPSSSPS